MRNICIDICLSFIWWTWMLFDKKKGDGTLEDRTWNGKGQEEDCQMKLCMWTKRALLLVLTLASPFLGPLKAPIFPLNDLIIIGAPPPAFLSTAQPASHENTACWFHSAGTEQPEWISNRWGGSEKPCPLIDGGQDGCFNTMRTISRTSIESPCTIQDGTVTSVEGRPLSSV